MMAMAANARKVYQQGSGVLPMSDALTEVSAETRLIAFNLLLEALRGGKSTSTALDRAREVFRLSGGLLDGAIPPGHVNAHIEAVLARESEPV
jgi:hypothetical protein